MSTSTTYTCDRCGQSQTDARDFLHTVLLFVSDAGSSYFSDLKAADREAQWCRNCCVALGIARTTAEQRAAGIAKPDPPPTLEQILTGWISECVDERMREQS